MNTFDFVICGVVLAISIIISLLSIKKYNTNKILVCPSPEKCTDGGYCKAIRSTKCSDGRCRWHCQMYCECEKRPFAIADDLIERTISRSVKS